MGPPKDYVASLTDHENENGYSYISVVPYIYVYRYIDKYINPFEATQGYDASRK